MNKVYKSHIPDLIDIKQDNIDFNDNIFNLLDNEIDTLNLFLNDYDNNIDVDSFLKEIDNKYELNNEESNKNTFICDNCLVDDNINKIINKSNGIQDIFDVPYISGLSYVSSFLQKTGELELNPKINKSKIIFKLVNNKREGRAKQIYSNGNILKFNYKNDIKNGKAMLIMKDGIINFNFKNDKRHGLCKIIMLNGSSMTYNYNNDIIDGKAYVKKPCGETFTLIYKNGKIKS